MNEEHRPKAYTLPLHYRRAMISIWTLKLNLNGRLFSQQIAVGRTVVGRIAVGRMTVGRIVVVRMAVVRIAVGRMAVVRIV